MLMRALAFALALAVTVTAAPFVAPAAEFRTIRPGESTQDTVRAQFGQASRVTSQKIEGYDSVQWLYEGAQAPRGMVKVIVDFGILTPQGYRPEIVRLMVLHPKPGSFTRPNVLTGWGEPDGTSTETGAPSVFYLSGLIVQFDKEGWNATTMTFMPPQKPSPDPVRR